MVDENTKIIRNSSILFFRIVVTSIIGLFASRFVIKNLGASDFGLYGVVGGVVVMMVFLNTVMISTTYRYIAFELGKGDLSGVNKIFNISLVIHFVIALIALLLTETLGVYYVKHHLVIEIGKLHDALLILRLSTYTAIFTIISVPYQGLVTAFEQFSTQAYIEIVRSILGLLIAIVLIFSVGNKLRIYTYLSAIISIIPAILFFLYCKKKYNQLVKWNFQREKSKYKEMISFSGWIMLGAGASIGQTSGSALIINYFFGTIVNAAFGIANQINNFVIIFSKTLGQAAGPQIIKSFSSGNSDRTMILSAYISKYTSYLMLFTALPILLETNFLLRLWLGEFPKYTVTFCKLIIISGFVSGLGSGLPAVIQATGKIKIFQLIISTTTLLGLPIAFILFKFGYPPFSILISYTIIYMINVVVWQLLLKKIINFNVRLFIKTTYLRIIYVLIFSVPLFIIKDIFSEGLPRFLFILFLSLIWLSLSIYFVGIDKKEKLIIKKWIKKHFKKNE